MHKDAEYVPYTARFMLLSTLFLQIIWQFDKIAIPLQSQTRNIAGWSSW